MSIQNELMQAILEERDRQDAIFGKQPRHRNPEVYLAVLVEEVGEIAKAILEKDSENYPVELVQVAAVCLAALEDYYLGNALYSISDVCGDMKHIKK